MLTDQTADEIPWNSNLIVVDSDVSSDSLYRAFRYKIKSQGFTIINENESERSFETQLKGIGRRVVLEVDGDVWSANEGSVLRLKGRVGDKQMNQTAEALTDLEGGSGDGERRATWYRGGDQQRGYAKLVQIAQELPGTINHKEVDT